MKASPREGHAGLPLAPRRLCTRWEDMMYQYATKYTILLKIRSALEIPPPAPPNSQVSETQQGGARARHGWV